MPPPYLFEPWMFGTELAFTVTAVVFCFLIYFKTKESYELTKHKGIQYFRDAFLFFGLSYVLRFVFGLLLLSAIAFEFTILFIPRSMIVLVFILFLGYFSTIGIFYLILSTLWRQCNNKSMLIVGHAAAVALSLVSFVTRSHILLLVFQSILLIAAVILSSMMHRGKKKVSQPRVLYFLVALLWLINLWIITPRRMPFSFELRILLEIFSIAVFVVIFSKISKWIK